MKSEIRTLLLIAISILLVGNTYSQEASMKEVMEVAKNYFLAHSYAPNTRSNYNQLSPEVAFVETRNNRNIYYVINFPNHNAHVYVTSDKRIKAVLGYVENLYIIDKAKPPAYIDWMEGYTREISGFFDEISKGKIYTTVADPSWDKYGRYNPNSTKTSPVGPLLTSCWDQTCLYNTECPTGNYCDHAPVGCVATAMAQILKYWNYPGIGNDIHAYTTQTNNYPLTVNFGSSTYLWLNMPPDNTSYSEVAEISYHCGVSIDMDYTATSSGASTYSAVYAYHHFFGYNPSTILYENRSSYNTLEDWQQRIKLELDNNRPVHYRGNNEWGNENHSFVCDGYSTGDYFHFNWGWSCEGNGVFILDDLTPETSSGHNHNYSFNQAAIFGILPLPISAPPNVSATDGTYDNVVSVSWNTVDYASHYRVFRSTSSGSTGSPITGWWTGTSYNDNTCTPGVTYYYRIKAASSSEGHNESIESGYNTGWRKITPPHIYNSNRWYIF